MSKHIPGKQPSLPNLHAIARQAVRTAGFVTALPPDARAQLAMLVQGDPQAMVDATVRDLRQLLWISLDNPESRDLDQISVAEALPDGPIRLLVGLADVDAWVPKGSPLDRYAFATTTSIYAGIEVFHMLPEQLSTEHTSLLEGQDRLAVVVELLVTAEGSVHPAQIYRGLVRNQRRIAYDAAAAWLEGNRDALPEAEEASELAEQLRLHDSAAGRLRGNREGRGAFEFDRLEVQAVFEAGQVADLIVVPTNRAREMIAEIMIATNSAVATYLNQAEAPTIERTQVPERWSSIVELAGTYEVQLPAMPDARALAHFLAHQRAVTGERYHRLAGTIAKLIGGSTYAAMPPGASDGGHFSLAVEHYTHATAPNRRYVDLVIQRLLKAAVAGQKPPYRITELMGIAERCDERGREASKVERFMLKVAASALLRNRVGDVFEAVVTGITAWGTYAQLVGPPVEGMIRDGDQDLAIGDQVRVQITGTNVERGFVDLERVI